ncbi:hypothetical protein CB1_001683064 [Camelus ferus]|nr:hypothetical protein CB1_001683064 [Camelus ferus]
MLLILLSVALLTLSSAQPLSEEVSNEELLDLISDNEYEDTSASESHDIRTRHSVFNLPIKYSASNFYVSCVILGVSESEI